MTTMDSDSESQDSDDGRRFRFEATRKDNVQADAKLTSKLQRETSSNDLEREDKKDRSTHDCNRGEHRLSKERDADDRDSKYSTKYLKHSIESRNSRREDNKDHRSARDATSDSKNTSLSWKHRTRDEKRHKNRDRNDHRSNRSEERSRSKNGSDRPQNDKHRNRSREKYKHHAYDRNRDKSYQSHKMRGSEHGKFRGETERYDSHRRAPTREDEGQRLKECSSPKNVEQGHSGNELFSMNREVSVESQECKELNLSEFDVLSETDENMSDSSDMKSRSSPSIQGDAKTKKRNLSNEHETTSKKQVIEVESMEGLAKVNAGKNDALYGSSNNSSGAISDSTLGVTSPILTEPRKNIADLNSKEGNLNPTEQTSLHPNNYDSVKTTTTYGQILPSQLATGCSSSSNIESNKTVQFIGPCLPKTDAEHIIDKVEEDTLSDVDRNNVVRKDSDLESDAIFGPALPPHLLKQKCDNDTNAKIIGPTLPSVVQSMFDKKEVNDMYFEEDDGIGPLPADHPALESNYAYRQLEHRAQKIQNDRIDQDHSGPNQREEWMTELPPAQIGSLGLTSRKFRTKEGPDMADRSCWTDTPAKKAEKRKRKEEETLYTVETAVAELPKRSIEVERWDGKKREKSLLEIHREKMRKKKRKEEKKANSTGQTIRRPFDRDIDLQVNRFDQAQKNAIVSKAQHLNERFSRGKF